MPATVATILGAAVPSLLAAWAAVLWTSRPAGRVGPQLLASGPRARSRDPAAEHAPRGPTGGHPVGVRLAAALASAVAVWAFLPGAAGPVAALVVALLVWRRSRAWEPASVRRRRLRVEAELPWVVDLLTAALRTGLGPVEALTRVVEVCSPDVRAELRVPLARLRLGVDPVSVWEELAHHAELGRLGVTLRRATESGAPVVEALSRLTDDLRDRRRAAVEVRIRRIEVRAAVPLGVCLLPAFVLLAVVPLVAGSVSSLLAR